MTDEPKPMTWADLADWIAKLTPEQRAMRAIVFDNDVSVFTSQILAFLASNDDAGKRVYGQPPSEVVERQPILKIW